MEDRVPQKPGRVLVAPEGGGEQFYATITRADEPLVEGTPLNANTLLRKVTAAKFGLGADNAVPDKVFDLVAAFVLSGGATTINVRDVDGNPLQGVRLIGVATEDGSDVVTDANGTASAIVQSNIDVTLRSPYADIPDYAYTLTPNFESVNIITITMPYATSGQIVAITESGTLKFRRSATVQVSVIGGGTGGTGGTGGGSSGYGQPNGASGRGGGGGASGLVYNTSFTATAETPYTLAIGAGGLGGAGGARDTDTGENDYSGSSGSSGSAGGATTFASLSSASGSSTTVPFNDSTLMYGGAGGSGGRGAGSSGGEDDGYAGSAGTRLGGTGGTGGNNYGSYYGSAGSDGGLGAGGGGGGGGGSRFYYDYCGNGGIGGNGGNGVLLIKF